MSRVKIDPHFVYVVYEDGFEGPSKIGVCAKANASNRFTNLNCGNWRELKVHALWVCDSSLSAYMAEALAHSTLTDLRIRGEWFDLHAWDAVERLREPLSKWAFDLLIGSRLSEMSKSHHKSKRISWAHLPRKAVA